MSRREHEELGLTGEFETWEQLPQHVSVELGYGQQPAYMTVFDTVLGLGEIAVETDMSAAMLPQELLASVG